MNATSANPQQAAAADLPVAAGHLRVAAKNLVERVDPSLTAAKGALGNEGKHKADRSDVELFCEELVDVRTRAMALAERLSPA